MPNIDVPIMHAAMKGDDSPIPLIPNAGSVTVQIAAIDSAMRRPKAENG